MDSYKHEAGGDWSDNLGVTVAKEALKLSVGWAGGGIATSLVDWLFDKVIVTNTMVTNRVALNNIEGQTVPLMMQYLEQSFEAPEKVPFDKATALFVVESESGTLVTGVNYDARINLQGRQVSSCVFAYYDNGDPIVKTCDPAFTRVVVATKYRAIVKVDWDFNPPIEPWRSGGKKDFMGVLYCPAPFYQSQAGRGYVLVDFHLVGHSEVSGHIEPSQFWAPKRDVATGTSYTSLFGPLGADLATDAGT